MNIKSLLLPFFTIIICFASCKNDKNKFVVVGDIADMPVQTVLLEELSIKETKLIDSVTSNEKGHFELSGLATEPGLYRLHFRNNQFIMFSVANENVKIVANWNNLINYDVAGSPSAASLKAFVGQLRKYVNDTRTLAMVMDSMRARGNDSLFQLANKDMIEVNVQLTRFIEQYADTTKYLPNALYAVQILNITAEKPYLDIFVKSINARFPNAKMGKDFVARCNEIMHKSETKVAPEGLVEGAMAPEISLNTVDGKAVTLSSFKGKYVLVDFWASWCSPCRKENPNVVAAYQRFKNKNFTILGVSLDNDKAKWEAAIKQDKLEWTQVSDLKGWESVAARDYNISSIPANFLIDPSGKIVARDLRGPDLENVLAETFK